MSQIGIREEILKQASYEPYRILSGFTDEGHFNQIAGGTIQLLNELEKTAVSDAFANSRKIQGGLEPVDLGNVVAGRLEGDGDEYLEHLEASEPFKSHFLGRKWDVALVHADRLCCFQPFIRTTYQEPASTGMLDILKYCLPLSFESKVEFTIALQPNTISILATSQSPNFAMEGVEITKNGPLIRFGANKNWVQAVAFNGRYYLKNGYHRVLRLLKAGIKEIPMLVYMAQTQV